MIKAALMTPNFSLGGAERWVVQMLAHVKVEWTGLVISGHCGADPTLCARAAKYTRLYSHRVPESQRRPGVHPFNPVGISHWHQDLWHAIERAAEGADVLVTWGITQGAGWFKDIRPTLPRVCVAHGTLQETPLRPLTGFTHLVAVSERALGYFAGREGAADLPREVIYNGVDPEHLTCTQPAVMQRAEWGCAPCHITVGVIGRQAQEKNHMAVARAMSHLPSSFVAVYYGRDRANYDEFAADLVAAKEQLGGRLQLRMPVAPIGTVLQALDVVVVASHREGCSLAMIEAWMAGVPVVATPVGSVPELQAKYGPLVIDVPLDPSPEVLAAAIMRAAGDEGHNLAARAKAVALEHFSIRTMAERWTEYLERVACSY